MPPGDGRSLWSALNAAGDLAGRHLWGADASVSLADLAWGSSLGGRRDELGGRSILLATKDQLTAALVLIELDGLARRLVLCPADLPPDHLRAIAAIAEADAVVSDRAEPDGATPGIGCFVTCRPNIAPMPVERRGNHKTEWLLLTSGTTGLPKLVVHDLESLAGPTKAGGALGRFAVWSTFYDIRRYGGLQMFFRALLGGGSLVLSSAGESTADFLTRAGARAVTHISGTPSHWRRALMSPAARRMAPKYVRLSGEIADQAILDHLAAFYPQAGVAHAFASTEAGVAFEVGDGLAGFPASLIGQEGAAVELRIEDGSLRIRSTRTASRYLGSTDAALADPDGFVDTGDMVERRGDRYYFVGRRGGIINVGGQKVHPEEVEAVINRHPGVRMCLVKARRSPITGAVVVADVVLQADFVGDDAAACQSDILAACRRTLAPYKVPAAIRFVPSLDVTTSGKLNRGDA
jgi:acyl-coenzyme A synthetase/AMP-(fatty) acid ligase